MPGEPRLPGDEQVDQERRRLSIVPVLGGIADPFTGTFTTLLSLFWSQRLRSRANTARRRKRGITFILGGVEGPSSYSYNMAMGLLRAGYRGSVVRVPWNRGVPVLRVFRNLMDSRHHERKAEALAARILRYKTSFPDAPVCLMAQSGGCWITLRALEKLPAGCDVQTVVWLAPSISPGRDVSAAATKCRGGLISIGGPGDFFFLGFGTCLLGASDRVRTPSAGWAGWRHHPPGFVELRWRREWVKFGYLGNHVTTSAVRFVQHVVAPWFVRGSGGTRDDVVAMARSGEDAVAAEVLTGSGSEPQTSISKQAGERR
jgi:hypothetical protein